MATHLTSKQRRCKLNYWNITMREQRNVFKLLLNPSKVINHLVIAKDIVQEKEERIGSHTNDCQERMELFPEPLSPR